MPRPSDPQSRERLLDAAEQLFFERGYHAVSMGDIAKALGIRKPSLYHHVPGGKEELFVEIAERNFKRHHDGLQAAIAAAEERLESQLKAIADWLIAQAPLGIISMIHNDMPALSAENSKHLEERLWISLWLPIRSCIEQAQARGEIQLDDLDTVVGGFLSMMDGITTIGTSGIPTRPMHRMADDLIDMMLNGLHKN